MESERIAGSDLSETTGTQKALKWANGGKAGFTCLYRRGCKRFCITQLMRDVA